jgi:hypothetical protein
MKRFLVAGVAILSLLLVAPAFAVDAPTGTTAAFCTNTMNGLYWTPIAADDPTDPNDGVTYTVYRRRRATNNTGYQTAVYTVQSNVPGNVVYDTGPPSNSSLQYYVKAKISGVESGRSNYAYCAGIYQGAWIKYNGTNGNPTAQAPWDASALTEWESEADKAPSVINFSAPFNQGAHSFGCGGTYLSGGVSRSGYCNFDSTAFTNARNSGAIPFYSWGPDVCCDRTVSQTDFTAQEIINGEQDPYIDAWATAAASWGHPFFLRLGWEMNGPWSNVPWGVGPSNSQADANASRDAWKHIHDRVDAVAPNVTWVWCPNIESSSTYQPLEDLYPGDSYVDWSCFDGYAQNEPATESFASFATSTYNHLLQSSLADGKPMFVGETAAVPGSGTAKATWITNTLTGLRGSFPQIKGFLYFNNYDFPNYPIDVPTDLSAQDAYSAALADAYFANDRFGSASATPVPPLDAP